MTYNLLKGGHAPGYLRDEFVDLLEVDYGGRFSTAENTAKLRNLTGQLWNCTDMMASTDAFMAVAFVENRLPVDPVDLSIGTYAQAARAIRSAIDAEATNA